jgi:hypothetical protein
MNQQLQLRYSHTDQTCKPIDKRRLTIPQITLAHYHFTGFQIPTETSHRYQHYLIVADDYDSLLYGLEEANRMMMERLPVVSRSDIGLVYLRNLTITDQSMINGEQFSDIKSESRAFLSKRDDNQYTVLGLQGKEICLIPKSSKDALSAIRILRCQTATQQGKFFTPLEVCQAHPVTKEFDALFNTVANRVKILLGCELSEGSSLH